MTDALEVRRVRLHEWESVKRLRIEAVGDPDAAIAFLTTVAEESGRDESFWRRRTAEAALSETAAQFIAAAAGRWVGSATVLLRTAGASDHLGRTVPHPRADIVGVYVAPAHRGLGVVSMLFDAAADWAAARGAEALTLDVHVRNLRAQAAYRKAGFLPTGTTFTATIGPELEMRRPLAAAAHPAEGGTDAQ